MRYCTRSLLDGAAERAARRLRSVRAEVGKQALQPPGDELDGVHGASAFGIVGSGTPDQAPDQAPRPGGEVGAVFASLGALELSYEPEALCVLFEHSNSLRQNVNAYATNIDGFGHRLDPATEFDADNADGRVGECIFLERLAARDRGELPREAELEPTPDENQGATEGAGSARPQGMRASDELLRVLIVRPLVRRTAPPDSPGPRCHGQPLLEVRRSSFTMRPLLLDTDPVPVEESVASRRSRSNA